MQYDSKDEGKRQKTRLGSKDSAVGGLEIHNGWMRPSAALCHAKVIRGQFLKGLITESCSLALAEPNSIASRGFQREEGTSCLGKQLRDHLPEALDPPLAIALSLRSSCGPGAFTLTQGG